MLRPAKGSPSDKLSRFTAISRDADAAPREIPGWRRYAVANAQHSHQRCADHVAASANADRLLAYVERSGPGNGVHVDHGERIRSREARRSAVAIEGCRALCDDDREGSARQCEAGSLLARPLLRDVLPAVFASGLTGEAANLLSTEANGLGKPFRLNSPAWSHTITCVRRL